MNPNLDYFDQHWPYIAAVALGTIIVIYFWFGK